MIQVGLADAVQGEGRMLIGAQQSWASSVVVRQQAIDPVLIPRSVSVDPAGFDAFDLMESHGIVTIASHRTHAVPRQNNLSAALTLPCECLAHSKRSSCASRGRGAEWV